MGRFLAIFRGAADEVDKAELTERQRTDFINAWSAWAHAHQRALVDPGAPLSAKRLVTADGSDDFTDSKTAYAVVEAASHDEAVRIFSEHPHLGLHRGNAIEVLECPPTPG